MCRIRRRCQLRRLRKERLCTETDSPMAETTPSVPGAELQPEPIRITIRYDQARSVYNHLRQAMAAIDDAPACIPALVELHVSEARATARLWMEDEP